MNSFFQILLFKNKIFWKVSTPQDVGTAIKHISSFFVFTAFAVGAFYFSKFITGYLLENVRIGMFLFHRFISMLLFVFFITINLGNMVVSFSTLYRSPEVSFLLSQPVSFLTIFTIKFLDNFFYSSGTLFMVGFSVVLGYGVYFHSPWYFYPLVMFGVLVPFMFLAGCVAVIVLLLLLTLASKINFKTLIAGVVLFYLAQVVIYFNVTSPVNLVREVMKYYPYIDLYFGNLDAQSTKILPNYWVSQILYFFQMGNVKAAAGYSALLILSTAGMCIVALLLGGKYFYSTWITSLSLKSLSTQTYEQRNSFFSFEKKSRLSPQVAVIVKKEFWQFVREPSQWIHLVVMIVLVFVFVSSVGTLDVQLQSAELRAIIYLVVFIFNAFLITSIALRFAFPMISLEGQVYWAVRSAPITTQKVYWIKFTLVTLLLLIFGVCISVWTNIPYREMADSPIVTKPLLPEIVVAYSLATYQYLRTLATVSTVLMIIIVITLVSFNFGMGALYSNFIEKNPIRIASSQGATLTFLLCIVFLVLVIVVFYYPVVSLFATLGLERAYNPNILYIACAIVAAMAVCIVSISHYIGIISLRKDF